MLGKRLLAIGLITLLGFLLGVGANLFYSHALPYMALYFPQLLTAIGTSWLIWGLIGAFIMVIASLLYAFFPDDNTRRILVTAVILLAVFDIILISLMTSI